MDKLTKLYKYLKNSNKKILFLTTSNRWEGEKELPKSSIIAHELAKQLKSVEIINVSKLKIFPCEGNVSNKDGNGCGVKAAMLKSNNPDKFIRCWASINNTTDEMHKVANAIYDADIVIFFGNYSTKQINEIHNLGDCYYLLHRGEGLGYAAYEAYLNHKPVIVTKYGGHINYFTENYPYMVDYTMCDVFGMEFALFYQHKHQWAEPNYEHAKQLLLQVYNKNK